MYNLFPSSTARREIGVRHVPLPSTHSIFQQTLFAQFDGPERTGVLQTIGSSRIYGEFQ